ERLGSEDNSDGVRLVRRIDVHDALAQMALCDLELRSGTDESACLLGDFRLERAQACSRLAQSTFELRQFSAKAADVALDSVDAVALRRDVAGQRLLVGSCFRRPASCFGRPVLEVVPALCCRVRKADDREC
ncbi:MAG: hypothetical protein H0T10_02580, partial [Actinobacteria bacterium]|nr:hypothetical protein [Actinomycetota bacterium]